ncbi:DNA cytosine methyltransferase [Achromobacter sp. AGC39]
MDARARWALVDGHRMRMLTTGENCAAMGFSRSYQLPESQAKALFMLGNANPPPLAEYAINAIRRHA